MHVDPDPRTLTLVPRFFLLAETREIAQVHPSRHKPCRREGTIRFTNAQFVLCLSSCLRLGARGTRKRSHHSQVGGFDLSHSKGNLGINSPTLHREDGMGRNFFIEQGCFFRLDSRDRLHAGPYRNFFLGRAKIYCQRRKRQAPLKRRIWHNLQPLCVP